MSSAYKRSSRVVLAVAVLALIVTAAGAAMLRSGPPQAGGRVPKPAPTKPPVKVDPVKENAMTQAWKDVDKLMGDQKFEEARELVEKIRKDAMLAKDEEWITRTLVKETQLRVGLHGYETAVRFLKGERWPEGLRNRVVLDLYYASTLEIYSRAYSWEIAKREHVDTKGEVDLKAWTMEEIATEARRSYNAAWDARLTLGDESVSILSEFLDLNDYPKEIRGTLRDALSYLFVEHLANTQWWRPEQTSELYRLDLPALMRPPESRDGKTATSPQPSLVDPATHPLHKIGAVLSDLETWHERAGRREAALEARLARLQRLAAAFTDERDRTAIRKELERHLSGFRDVPWWAMGRAALAEMVRQAPQPGRLVAARAIAEQAAKAYPDSPGGRRCQSLVASLDAPSYQVSSMSADASGKRSIEVKHKNLREVFFRAYPVDLVRRIESARDYNLLPNANEIRSLIDKSKPAAAWKVELPETPDLEMHKTFVVPPLSGLGLHVVTASMRSDFAASPNQVLATPIVLTDLVLITRDDLGGGHEVTVLSGATGAPVADARVSLYQYDWQHGHSEIAALASDAEGRVHFDATGGRQGKTCFFIARKGRDVSLDASYRGFYARSIPEETTSALVYSDRSVYRPSQKLLWKVVAYRGQVGGKRIGQFRTLAESPITVSLHDPNGERVETKTLTTNSYGSASSEFVIPKGRLLGNWRLETSLGGAVVVRVEEYKRPTFEAEFQDPKEPLRLNRPATFTGRVRYYFGLPVVNGAVKWRVQRQPVYPWWWGYLHAWGYQSQPNVIASGTSSLREDGTFELTFTPAADERAAEAAHASKDRNAPDLASAITYRYQLQADVTDEGGETRSAERSFRLGFVSVEARIDLPSGFRLPEVSKGEVPEEPKIVRTSLDGVPRPGKGRYRIFEIKQPKETPLPADLPADVGGASEDGDLGAEASAASGYRTPGDGKRARWETSIASEAILRGFPDGREIASGELFHDGKGEAALSLPRLSAGAYRIRYETIDDFGATFRTSKDLLVAARSTPLALPLHVAVERSSVRVGETARVWVHSGLLDQPVFVNFYRSGELFDRKRLAAGRDAELFEIPIQETHRGGFSVSASLVRDHQFAQAAGSVFVPWDDRELKVTFATFRDRMRPGAKETFRIKVSPAVEGGKPVEAGTAELLAYMYDRSLDLFAPHSPPGVLGIYPTRTYAANLQANLGLARGSWIFGQLASPPGYPVFQGDRVKVLDRYGIGGPGRRGIALSKSSRVMERDQLNSMAPQSEAVRAEAVVGGVEGGVAGGVVGGTAVGRFAFADAKEDREAKDKISTDSAPSPVPLRSNFAETAFWIPNLLTEKDGTATLEFQVPDSVTSWNVWVHALTRDLRGGSAKKEARSVKELMVRPYLPRFFREGDQAQLKVVVNNASEKERSGTLRLEILDPDTNESLGERFGLKVPVSRPFRVPAGGGTDIAIPISTPSRVGLVAFKVTAVSDDLSDGELRPLPVLPGRVHLAQSRFVTLRGRDRKLLTFADLKDTSDASRIDEKLVVTVDAQLFYTVLQSLPYLVNYPYECTEQTLNRFVSTGIVSSLYKDYPAVARMAQEMGKRETQFERWDDADPNRKMALEETPWLFEARGGKTGTEDLTNVLDPRIAKAEREASLAKLRKAQTANGAFPWWPGGPPSPYMTLYIMHGFAKAAEFGVEVPKDMVQRGWAYLAAHFRSELRPMMARDCCWEFLTFLNYVASAYPDASWVGGALSPEERREILDFTFRHWRDHSPYLKGYLSLTLKRMGQPKDAALVWQSVMDSAKTSEDEGTHWAAEDRSWLWYNDTIETHAFALRTLMELTPTDLRRDGLVQWLLLNKKLNQWKSTRATAEVIYSLIHYLKAEGALGIREDATVTVGAQKVAFVFEPDKYTGKKNQIVVPSEKIDPKTMSTVVVEKESKGFAFASAVWHFSTERLPTEDSGDFYKVSRRYFKRENTGREWVLKPLADGAVLAPGDQVEVQISLRTKHASEYVHLKDPRAAGLEPENPVSRYKWDLGISWYEEIRDSGTNFFFEGLPVGEYTFKYRLRANMAGTFRVGPATVQSMYAPEFLAYSAGHVVTVREK